MLDRPSDKELQSKWSPTPDWLRAAIIRGDWSAHAVRGLGQTLVSGDLVKAREALAPGASEVGLWDETGALPVQVRIGRDRALFVTENPLGTESGWRDGFAVSSADDLWLVIDLEGEGVREVLREGTAADLDGGSASASVLFAGVPALLYRFEGRTRLHVEAPLGAYLWRWLETRVG
ncbi:hypothetical protein NGM99_14560 [Mesorhizobium sp. RP14(2022)]|uniref:DUF1285 domain-containing protein n=1 Tax=Mesorhizobium liriopis TaxID=2953882 RepID=A0ABT1C839_9HYPH|nr:hypothetical protein [Mesorhizobium liriopis]MCO6051002.1 hypothetical protein [Mesorhizobium liriopis]